MTDIKANPLLVEVTRGDLIESRHRGAVVVVDEDGKIVAGWGDVDRLIYPRSAVKPFQAMVSVESGAFDAFNLTEGELALHSASHNGEEDHVGQVKNWLDKIGLSVNDLECGTHLPMWISRNPGYQGAFAGSCPLHNNCSGKHAGFLTTARYMGVSLSGYINPEHPVQQATKRLIADMTGVNCEDMPVAMDACRAPTFGLPLQRFAYGLARLGSGKGLGAGRTGAAERVCRAMRAFPWNVAGTGRPETLLMADKDFAGIAKCGAEGVYALTLPQQGMGLALKVDDGSDRAAHVIAMAVLHHLGVLNNKAMTRLSDLAQPPIRNWAGQDVGIMRCAKNSFLQKENSSI